MLSLRESQVSAMITAFGDVKNVVQSFRALCDASIFKPMDTAKLLRELRALALVA